MTAAILFLCISTSVNKPRMLSFLPRAQANCQQVKVLTTAQDLPNFSKGGWNCSNQPDEDFTECDKGTAQYFIQAPKTEPSRAAATPSKLPLKVVPGQRADHFFDSY